MMRVKVQINWSIEGMRIQRIVHVGDWTSMLGPSFSVQPYWKFEDERDGQMRWIAQYMLSERERLLAEGVDEVVCTWSSAVMPIQPFDVEKYADVEEGDEETSPDS